MNANRSQSFRSRLRAWTPLKTLVSLAAVSSCALTGANRPVAVPPSTEISCNHQTSITRCLLEPLSMRALPCASAILIEEETGEVLYEQGADEIRAPASLIKMALQLVVYRDIEAGVVALGDSVSTSANASTMGGSQVFLKHNERQTLEALLEAIVIASANDAAMAVAEHMEGSEAAFVARMNDAAKDLGCTATRFTNVHGLDLRGQERSVTTARDLVRIARELLQHPLATRLSSTWRAPLRGGEFWLNNTNLLLRHYPGLDGLKTGYTSRAGGCFCGTATRDDVRLISVVMGARPGTSRFDLTRRLLDRGFAGEPRWVDLAHDGQDIAGLGPVPVHDAERPGALAISGGAVRVLVEKERLPGVELRVRALRDLRPPLRPGDSVGYLDCRIDGRTFASVPARAGESVSRMPELSPLSSRE